MASRPIAVADPDGPGPGPVPVDGPHVGPRPVGRAAGRSTTRSGAATPTRGQAIDERITRMLDARALTQDQEKTLDDRRQQAGEIRRQLLDLERQFEDKYRALAGAPNRWVAHSGAASIREQPPLPRILPTGSSPPPGQAVRRLCRQGRRHRRIPPRTNLQRGRPRYYFENLGKIFSPSLAGRSVEKMASDAGTPFKFLQSWTILLVGRQRGKNQGTGGFESCDARKQSRTGIRDDRGPRMIGPGRCIGLVADCGGWHRVPSSTVWRCSRPATFEEARKALPEGTAHVGWLDTKSEHWACMLRHAGEPAWVRLTGSGTEGAWTKEEGRGLPRLRPAAVRPRGAQPGALPVEGGRRRHGALDGAVLPQPVRQARRTGGPDARGRGIGRGEAMAPRRRAVGGEGGAGRFAAR